MTRRLALRWPAAAERRCFSNISNLVYTQMMEWEEFEAKLKRWQNMNQSWWTRWSASPPLYRMMWKKKHQIKPPVFENSFKLALGMAFYFAFAMAAIFCVPLYWSSRVSPDKFGSVLLICLFAGVLFGILTSFSFYIERKLRKLPKWEDI